MNKIMLVFTPILAAGIAFAVSGSNFLKSGIPTSAPEHIELYSLSDKGLVLLQKEIITPLQNYRKKDLKAEMYSRCPSGISHYVMSQPTKEDNYYSGKVFDRVGCSSNVVCYFRIDKSETVLEAKSKEEQEYLPVAQWKATMKGSAWSF